MGYRYGMMGYGWGWHDDLSYSLDYFGSYCPYTYLQFSGKENYRAVENNANILNERYARGEITE